MVSLLRPPDHVGMPRRRLIKVDSQRAHGVHYLQRHIPSTMKVPLRGKCMLTTVFPDLLFRQTIHPED